MNTGPENAAITDCESVDDNKPLWQFVTKLMKIDGGGNVSFRCNICEGTYKGSYYRVKAHLLKISGHGIKMCPKVTHRQQREMQKLVDEATSRIKNALPKNVPLPSLSSSSQSSCSVQMGTLNISPMRQLGYEPKKRKALGDTALEKAFNLQVREQLDNEIARMFFSAGLPFTLAKNPYYKSCFTFAANTNISGYVPPGYNVLRTKLLQREKANIERLLDPLKGTWREKGVSIVCDGWTDPQRRPLINFMAVTEGGPMFLRAINCEGEVKDKYFISNLIKEVIMEVGATFVVQIVTDNAPVCRAAGLLIQQTYPHIFWTPCVVHTLNLALKNICAAKNTEANEIVYGECHWITEVAGDAIGIKNFIMNHSMRLAMFNDFSKLKMLAIADTRFASVIVMLKRFKLIKNGLQAMVISEKWSCYREDDVVKARNVKEKLLDDLWWDKIDYILKFTEPIYEMLRVADTDKPCLHLIYDMWDSMISKVKAVIFRHEERELHEESSFWNVVHSVLIDRWSKSNTPLHCLAYSLNPRYSSKEWLAHDLSRIPPQKDLEISSMRKECLRRYFPNEEERRAVNLELAQFFGFMNEFADEESIRDRWEMEPKYWWIIHGASAPLLQNIAIKLLGQPCSSSCCERNWSTYSFIHSLRRNKITPQRAEDLVYVHNNLRLLSRRTPQYAEGESKMWDVAGDSFESMDDFGIFEIANLSLDEPDFEAVLFMDDNGDKEDNIQPNDSDVLFDD